MKNKVFIIKDGKYKKISVKDLKRGMTFYTTTRSGKPADVFIADSNPFIYESGGWGIALKINTKEEE